MADLWYYTSEGKQMEPVTAGELKQLAGSGFLKPADMVWKEGMANWVPASSLKGLFPAGAPAAATAVAAQPQADPIPVAEDAPDDASPRKRRRLLDDDEGDADAGDRPRRRRRERESGGWGGAVIGIIAGVAILFFVLLGIAFYFIFRSPSAVAPKGDVATYSASLGGNGGTHSRNVDLKAGRRYHFSVTSDRNTDVDLFVHAPNGAVVGFDESVGPNSFVEVVTAVDGPYSVRLRNLDRRSNRSHVGVSDMGAFAGPPNPPINFKGNIPFPKIGFNPPPVPNAGLGPMTTETPPAIGPGGSWNKTVTFPAGKQVQVILTSTPLDNDVDIVVTGIDAPGHWADISIGPNGQVSFPAVAGKTYRIQLSNLGDRPANATLRYTTP